MSKAGLGGLQLATSDMITVAKGFSTDEWQMPSAAARWSVHDVISHAGNLLGVLMDAVNGTLVVPEGMGIEALNDMEVAEHRSEDSLKTVAFLEAQLAKALSVFTPLQDEPYASQEAQLLDLGTYPLHAIVDMFTFDFTTHLRYDILAPRGPIARTMEPLGEALLGPAVSWLLAGIPKMQPDLWSHLDGPLGLVLTGPASTSVVLNATNGRIAISPTDSESGAELATAYSTTADFLAWSTTRMPWRDLVKVEGDDVTAANFLDALNLT